MAVIEDCPDEVLLCILSRLHRCEELSGLSLACRRFRSLVSPLLQDSRKFRHLDFGCIESPRLPCVPFRSILHRPELSSYVLQIQLALNDYESNYDTTESDLLSEAEDGELFERAVGDLRICEWEDGEDLIGALEEGDQSCRVALLLLMHPNMEDLSIQLAADDWWLQRIVWMFTSSFPVPPPRSCLAFHALREVHFRPYENADEFDLESLLPFFLLPSIQKISGHMASRRNGLDWEREDYISTVTDLSFTCSCICLSAFNMLLRIPKGLHTFFYGFGQICANVDFDYDELLAVVKDAQGGLDEANIEILDEF